MPNYYNITARTEVQLVNTHRCEIECATVVDQNRFNVELLLRKFAHREKKKKN